MIPELRQEFNRRWRPELYQEFLRRLDEATGTHVTFRSSETPVFLPEPLIEKMIRYGRELYQQLANNPAYLTASKAAVPEQFRVPQQTEHPLFLQADFGVVEENGEYEPKLVEIQGFPSIYGFQMAMARAYEQVYQLQNLDAKLTAYLGGFDAERYAALLSKVILNGHDPEQVALVEIDPQQQKTLPDFLCIRTLLGIRMADIRELRKRGRRLYLNGVEIKRIYNRVIADELVRKKVDAEFRFTDDLDVEWAGHPDWFFRISKFSLPWLKHASVPETWFLNELAAIPEDLESYVLKPLYSFAGLGVKLAPSAEDIKDIPAEERRNYVLQRRVNFVPTLETPAGLTKIEVRVMYIMDGELKPVITLLRSGRGKMMGVDFNRDLEWVGASAGFRVPA